eukprot:117608-Rhodomonas_salina.2
MPGIGIPYGAICLRTRCAMSGTERATWCYLPMRTLCDARYRDNVYVTTTRVCTVLCLPANAQVSPAICLRDVRY